MIVIAGLIIGAILGSLQARKRGGRRLDMLQYGAVYALIFTIIGMFITIVIDRMI